MRTYGIIGAGPAAIIAGLLMAKAGRRVVLLGAASAKRTSYIGQSLPPNANVLLKRLGLWDSLQNCNPSPCPGNYSIWGNNEAEGIDFISSPFGNGWHIDRNEFDGFLEKEFLMAGGVIQRAFVSKVSSSAKGWVVHYRKDEISDSLEVDFLINASGRNGVKIGNGVEWVKQDRLVSMFTTVELLNPDQRSWLEARPNGWWYSAPSANGQQTLAYFTDADLLPKKVEDRTSFLMKDLQQTTLIQQRGIVDENTSWRALNAATIIEQGPLPPNYLSVGDASLAMDPLSSSGVTYALESGMRAAQAIINNNLIDYKTWQDDYKEQYLKDRAHYYSIEKRWSNEQFWQRRHRKQPSPEKTKLNV